MSIQARKSSFFRDLIREHWLVVVTTVSTDMLHGRLTALEAATPLIFCPMLFGPDLARQVQERLRMAMKCTCEVAAYLFTSSFRMEGLETTQLPQVNLERLVLLVTDFITETQTSCIRTGLNFLQAKIPSPLQTEVARDFKRFEL